MNKRSTVVLAGLMAFIAVCGLSLAGCKDDIQDVSIVTNKAPAPGNVTVIKDISNNIVVKFDAVDNASGYTLYIKKQGNKLIGNLNYSSITENAGTVTIIAYPSIASGNYEVGVQTDQLITGGILGAPSDPVWVNLTY